MQIASAQTKPQRIACRICEQIFSTPQTLISHIESDHMKNDLSTLPSSSRKPYPFSLNPLCSYSSSYSAASSSAATLNHFHYRNLYNFPMMRNNIDLNYYRNQFYDFGRFHNGFVTGAQPQPAMMARNNFSIGLPQQQQQPQQMQLFPVHPATAMATQAGDCTLPLLHQLEQRKAETSVPCETISFSNPIDLTLKL